MIVKNITFIFLTSAAGAGRS